MMSEAAKEMAEKFHELAQILARLIDSSERLRRFKKLKEKDENPEIVQRELIDRELLLIAKKAERLRAWVPDELFANRSTEEQDKLDEEFFGKETKPVTNVEDLEMVEPELQLIFSEFHQYVLGAAGLTLLSRGQG